MIFGAKMGPSWEGNWMKSEPHMEEGENAKTLKNHWFLNVCRVGGKACSKENLSKINQKTKWKADLQRC